MHLADSSRARSLALCLLGASMAMGLAYLLLLDRALEFPNWYWPHPKPYWWPFRQQTHAYPWAAILTGLAAFALIGAAVVRATSLSTGRLAILLTSGSLLVNIAAVALPGDGLKPYARRLVKAGHAEFFIRASLHPHILSTLRMYETLIRDGEWSYHLRQKGPATMAYHVALHRLAQTAGIRRLLDWSVQDDAQFYERTYQELRRKGGHRYANFDEARGTEVVRTSLLMPVVSALICGVIPLAILLLGSSMFPRDTAVVAAATAAVVPPILFEHVHLDGSLLPLLFALGFALFAYARWRKSYRFMLLAGAAAALYAYFTLAAGVLVALCVISSALDGIGALRRTEAPEGARVDAMLRPDSRWSLKAVALYGLGLAASLLFLRLVLAFHVVDRYLVARRIQAGFQDLILREHEASWRWMILNGVEFSVSLGPLLVCLAVIGVCAGMVALVKRRASVADTTSVAVLCVFALLLAVGQNANVYRLWAFLGLAFLVPAVHAGRELFRFGRPGGRLIYWVLASGWSAAVATRYGHLS